MLLFTINDLFTLYLIFKIQISISQDIKISKLTICKIKKGIYMGNSMSNQPTISPSTDLSEICCAKSN